MQAVEQGAGQTRTTVHALDSAREYMGVELLFCHARLAELLLKLVEVHQRAALLAFSSCVHGICVWTHVPRTRLGAIIHVCPLLVLPLPQILCSVQIRLLFFV